MIATEAVGDLKAEARHSLVQETFLMHRFTPLVNYL